MDISKAEIVDESKAPKYEVYGRTFNDQYHACIKIKD